MSANNGVIRIGRKGRKKFAFGEDGEAFEVDVVQAFQQWVDIDERFREQHEDRTIPNSDMPQYHQAAATFVASLGGIHPDTITIAEALDFIARLREQYDEVVVFFQPKSREKRDSPDTSGVDLQFSAEES